MGETPTVAISGRFKQRGPFVAAAAPGKDMKHIIFDSHALMAYFQNEKGADIVEEHLHHCLADTDMEGWLSPVNHGEILYMLTRKASPAAARTAMEALQPFSFSQQPVTLHQCLAAAAIKAVHRLSYADAFAAALTIELRGTLLTGDTELTRLKLPHYQVKSIR